MKTGAFVLAFMVFTLVFAYAQNFEDMDEIEIMDEAEIIEGEGIEFFVPQSKDKMVLTLNWGAAASWLTRIIKQDERSNFVFRDFLPGLYLTGELRNVPYLTPVVRLAAYYPIVSTFNRMPQPPKVPLHYAFDVVAGVKFEILDFKYVRLNLSPAVHLFFLNSERWNYLNLGAAAVAGIEVPLTSRWTLLFDGYASLDSGNLGGNRLMESFDITYQYQVDIGVRYNKKWVNKTPLFSL